VKFIIPQGKHRTPIGVEIPDPVTDEELARVKSCIRAIKEDRWEDVTLEKIQGSQEILLKILLAFKAKAREYEPPHECDCGRCRAARGEI